jgi:hypothetical protein
MNNISNKTSRTLRNKEREYLKDGVKKLGINGKKNKY